LSHTGELANAVRAAPHAVRICSAVDGAALGCEPVVGGGGVGETRAVADVDPGAHGDGLGHGMHVFEMWLEEVDSGQNLLPVNASSVFASRNPGALHMPDSHGEQRNFLFSNVVGRVRKACGPAAFSPCDSLGLGLMPARTTDVFYAECYHHRSEEMDEDVGAAGAAGAAGGATSPSSSSSSAPVRRRLPLARGILHVGANQATEAAGYAACVGGGGANVVFVECDPEVSPGSSGSSTILILQTKTGLLQFFFLCGSMVVFIKTAPTDC